MGDPYAEGYDAGIAGASEATNPYDARTNERAFVNWIDGWNAAGDDDIEEPDVELIE